MKNSTYNSVPVIASIIGSKSRKAMYLTGITSLDGTRIYKDKWIPTSWNTNTKTEFRYTNKERGIHNQLVHTGKYYRFDFKESVLMTDQGAVNEHGSVLDVKGLTKVKISDSRQTIAWEYESQSLVEFPMSKASEAMVIEKYDDRNVSRIKSKLIDGKVADYYQIQDRYIIHIPKWLIKNFEERYTIKESIDDYMANEDNYETVIEKTALDSVIAKNFDYITRNEMNFEEIDSLTQWEMDNPEYQSY